MMNPEYFALTFDAAGFDVEICMAMLGQWPFESFHEDGHTITGYILKHDITRELTENIDEMKGIYFRDYEMAQVPHQNWNAVWESSFNPVSVDSYCYIRAAFHPGQVEGFRHEVLIAPKMAFGTGHHATTFMMLRAMASIDFQGKQVLDFGCGTGILSVVAAMEGAAHVLGVDTQPEAKENSYEHAMLNHVEEVCQFEEGSLEWADGKIFDVILANINVSVIAAHFEQLKSMLKPGGYILLSGIMTYDRKYMEEHIRFEPLEKVAEQEKNEWIQLTLRKEA